MVGMVGGERRYLCTREARPLSQASRTGAVRIEFKCECCANSKQEHWRHMTPEAALQYIATIHATMRDG